MLLESLLGSSEFRVLCQGTQVQFSPPMWHIIIVCTSRSRGSDILTHICRQNTDVHKLKITKSLKSRNKNFKKVLTRVSNRIGEGWKTKTTMKLFIGDQTLQGDSGVHTSKSTAENKASNHRVQNEHLTK